MEIITKVYRQQKNHFETDNPREDTYDVLRILNVSLLTRMPLVELLTEACAAEIEDSRYVQLQLEFKD